MATFFCSSRNASGLEIAEGEIFELAADQAHAEPVGDGRVNIERFAGDALLALGSEIFERAHVVQAVGELHHHDANVVHHGEKHLADVFGLASFGGEQIEPADFRDAFDQARDIRAKLLGNFLDGNLGVFDDVVKKRGAQRGHVELHVREQMRHFDGMRKVGLAGEARLRFVLLGGEIVGAAKKIEIVARAIVAHLVQQLDEAQIDGAPRRDANRRFAERVH